MKMTKTVTVWVGRDKNGTLVAFTEKPFKLKGVWYHKEAEFYSIPPFLLPEVKWEDENPTEIEITIKK